MNIIRSNEWYRTDKDTLLHITTEKAPDIPSSFRSNVKGTDEAKVCADVLRKCCDSDSAYTRRALKEPFRQLIDISIKQENDSRTAFFRKTYGDRDTLLSFSLYPNDDVQTDSLYCLFADSLERILLEPDKGQSRNDLEAFDKIVTADNFRLESIIPSCITRISDEYICFYIPPVYLSGEPSLLTDEGEKEYGTKHAEDLLYRFISWAETRLSYGYEEYSVNGIKLRGKGGFYGSDFNRSGMKDQAERILSGYLGLHPNVRDCLTSIKSRLSLDDCLSHLEKELGQISQVKQSVRPEQPLKE